MQSIKLKNLPAHLSDLKPLLQRWKVYLAAGALILAGTGSYAAYWLYTQSQAQSVEDAQLNTAVARLGNLVVSASAAGTVIAPAEIGLGFEESGILSEMLVQVGERVEAGQVLARLKTNKTEEEIALALAEAQLNVLTAQQALDDLYTSAQLEAAQALIDIETSEQELNDLQNPDLRLASAAQAVAEAQEALRTAQLAYNSVRSSADADTIAAAYAELVLAEKRLKDLEDKFDDYANKPDDNLEKANLRLKLSEAQKAYNSALSYYNAVTSTGSQLELERTAADLAAAQAQLSRAQEEYERVRKGPTPGEIALVEANLALAQKKYEILKNGPDPAEVALAEAQLAAAKAKLALAQEDRAVIDLVAPQGGTILSIDASVGETVGTEPIITLADLSQPPILEVYLDETDLDMVGVGYKVEVVFDSLPDDTFTGQVIEVSPVLQTIGNVTTVVAKVRLDTETYSKPLSIPVGANASVEVIGGYAENVVLVPVEALRDLGDGQYAVFVMEGGEPRLRMVTVGLMDYSFAEITSGLEPGEVVTTGLVEINQSGSSDTSSSNKGAGEIGPGPVEPGIVPPGS